MTSGRRTARLEHRLTGANATTGELEQAVALAVGHDLAALTVSPWLVKAAKRGLWVYYTLNVPVLERLRRLLP